MCMAGVRNLAEAPCAFRQISSLAVQIGGKPPTLTLQPPVGNYDVDRACFLTSTDLPFCEDLCSAMFPEAPEPRCAEVMPQAAVGFSAFRQGCVLKDGLGDA